MLIRIFVRVRLHIFYSFSSLQIVAKTCVIALCMMVLFFTIQQGFKKVENPSEGTVPLHS